MCLCSLAEPPNFFVEDDTNKVNNPNKNCTGNNAKNAEDDTESVACINTSCNTVNCPNNVKGRNAKNELNNPRKIVNCFDERIHFNYLFRFFWIIKV